MATVSKSTPYKIPNRRSTASTETRIRPTMGMVRPSMGMVLCSRVGNDILYGLVKRRYGYGMQDILKSNFYDETCFTEICDDERTALLHICSKGENWENVYAKLWTESMWNKDTCSFEYTYSINKFIENKDRIATLLKNTKSLFPKGIWGFPKGKPERGENDISCAIREAMEETEIKNVSVLPIDAQFETYKLWNYKYFVGVVQAIDASDRVIENNPEISSVMWCNFDHALKLIPKDATDKKRVLTKINALVSKML